MLSQDLCENFEEESFDLESELENLLLEQVKFHSPQTILVPEKAKSRWWGDLWKGAKALPSSLENESQAMQRRYRDLQVGRYQNPWAVKLNAEAMS